MTLTSHWYAATVSGWSAYTLLWLFLVYSFFGVVIETLFCLVREGVLESRLGLLYLPLRPMYGVGGVASVLLLDRWQQQPILVFLGGMAICTAVEYVGGSICDAAFGTLSWDYGDKPLQLHGKVCLEYSCYWGLLAGLTVYVLNPAISAAVDTLDRTTGEVALTVVVGLSLALAVLTAVAWSETGKRVAALRAQAGTRDDQSSAPVASTVTGRVVARLVPDLLLINTFPRTRLAQELMSVTGLPRLWIGWSRPE